MDANRLKWEAHVNRVQIHRIQIEEKLHIKLN